MDVEPCEARSPPPRHGSCYSLTHTAPAYAAIRPEMYGIDRRAYSCVVPEALLRPRLLYSTVYYIYVCVFN